MRVLKSVWQYYAPDERTLFFLNQFRLIVNECIRVGLAENLTSLRSLYGRLSQYDLYSKHKLCAINAARGILRNYRKAKRKNPRTKEPYARRLRLTSCYDVEIQDDMLILPLKAKESLRIPLTSHVQTSIANFQVRSVTLTENTLSIAYAKDVQEIRPKGFVGIDRNLDNVTIAASDGTLVQHDLSESTRVKARYRELRSHFKRNDARICRRVSQKYGRKQYEKVKQILHHASKRIVMEAKEKQYAIVMEKLTGIRKLYRRGNGQGRWYRGRMNSWSHDQLRRQIEYKAKWLGLPVITIPPRGTTSKCSICGQKMRPEENRMLRCPSCGYRVDRDVNAARNILEAGRLRFDLIDLASEGVVREPSRQEVIPKLDARKLTLWRVDRTLR